MGAEFIISYEYSFFAKMEYLDVRWSVFSSYSLQSAFTFQFSSSSSSY